MTLPRSVAERMMDEASPSRSSLTSASSRASSTEIVGPGTSSLVMTVRACASPLPAASERLLLAAA
eukprot:3598126-Heterocapsa_arctica.AAC.1